MSYIKDGYFAMRVDDNTREVLVDIKGQQQELPSKIKYLGYFIDGWAVFGSGNTGLEVGYGYYNNEGEFLTIKVPKE